MLELTYESAYSKLEKIVEDLESGELPLEESLSKYEEGLKLYNFCENFLNNFEGKIEILSKDKLTEGNYVEVDFLEMENADE